jgi:hypothetical protein
MIVILSEAKNLSPLDSGRAGSEIRAVSLAQHDTKDLRALTVQLCNVLTISF